MMTTPQQRETVVKLVDEAVSAGARRSPACQVVGINVRTLQRWRPQGEQQDFFDDFRVIQLSTPRYISATLMVISKQGSLISSSSRSNCFNPQLPSSRRINISTCDLSWATTK